MWCAHCQADVAAEVTANRHRILCASCGSDLANSGNRSAIPQTDQAQQILDRWSHREMPVPSSPGVSVSSVADPSRQMASANSATVNSATVNSATVGSEIIGSEIIGSETTPNTVAIGQPAIGAAAAQPGAAAFDLAADSATADSNPAIDDTPPADLQRGDMLPEPPTSGFPEDTLFRVDEPHTHRRQAADQNPPQAVNDPPRHAWPVEQSVNPTVLAPQMPQAREPVPAEPQPLFTVSGFDAQLEISRRQQRQAKWVVSTAQFLAYCGIGGLTVGTACVIWGYFGGVTNYLPMGWLVLSFGQMLLFLGMVTMVSCSVEQTSTDITRQLAEIQKQLARMPLPPLHTQAPVQTPRSAPLDPAVQAGDRQPSGT